MADLPAAAEVPALVWSGLAAGAVGAGLGAVTVLVGRTTNVLNLSVGALYVAGAMLVAELTGRGAAVGVALVLAVALGAALGGVEERAVLRRLRRSPPSTQLLATIGSALVVLGALGVAVGRDPVAAPPLVDGGFEVGSTAVSWAQVLLVAAAVAVGVAAEVWLRATRGGLQAAAVSDDADAAASIGIDVARLRTGSLVAMGAAAGLLGTLAVPLYLIDVNTGIEASIVAFLAFVLGGGRSPAGALLAGFAIGVVESVAARIVSVPVAEALVATAVLVVLLTRAHRVPGLAAR